MTFPLAVLLLIVCPAAALAADSFSPGELWPDDRGVHINAHGHAAN
jgi:hypothetical protein